MTNPTVLPVKFENPPVVEVACGVLFNALEGLKAPKLGLFWTQLRDRFPRLEEAPAIPPVVEPATITTPQMQVQLLSMPPMRRVWFLSENGSRLIQIQQDRFLYNWKQVNHDDRYPSYDTVIKDFEKYFAQYIGFLKSEQLGDLIYRQFDLSYINIIGRHNGLETMAAGEILRDHIRDKTTNRFLPEPEAFSWNSSYALPGGVGRLHMSAQSALRVETGEKILRLELTARGIPKDPSEVNRRPWFNLAHEWITRGFADSTAQAIQQSKWKRQS